MYFLNKQGRLPLCILIILISGCTSNNFTLFKSKIPSSVWNESLRADHSIFPDFSYSGYRANEENIPSPDWPIIHVSQFGAYPNDDKSDTEQIELAIATASKLNGAIVEFSEGAYQLDNNKKNKSKSMIDIVASKLIIRGQGSGLNGTVLYFPEHLTPQYPELMWSTPAMINISGSNDFYKGKVITHISQTASKGQKHIEVADPSRLKAGDYIILNVKDPRYVKDLSQAPIVFKEEWNDSFSGEVAREYNRIVLIKGNTLVLERPVLMDINAKYSWQVRKITLGTQIGVENIAFQGGWREEFVHHKSAKHDSGWSAINISQVADSWMKNVRFKDWNETIKINGSYGLSLFNIVTHGNRGHFGIHITSSHGVLVANSADCGPLGQYHAYSVSSYASGTVFYNVTWPSSTSFDTHARYPHATLFDNAKGGFLVEHGGTGGGVTSRPHHMQDLVIWNFHSTDPKKHNTYSWWNNTFVVKPKIVGWVGNYPEFNSNELSKVEALGFVVTPDSLFRAQLNQRLGAIPQWILDSQNIEGLCSAL